jgi:alkylation response protein AidB-like acyl-CoA dehydrogenase
MEWERCCILASHVGAMEYRLEECLRYARTRRQFDQPIGKFQAVANRIAEMKVRLETARLILYKVAWLKKMNKPAMIEAAIAKLYLSECFVQSSLDIRPEGEPGVNQMQKIWDVQCHIAPTPQLDLNPKI